MVTTSLCDRCFYLHSTDEEGGSQVVVQWWWIHMQCRRRGFNPWVRKIPLEEDRATHSFILAWKIPWTEEPGWQQSMGSKRVGHNWVHLCALTHTHTPTFTYIHTHTHTHTHTQMRKLKPRGNLPKITEWAGQGRFECSQSGSIVHVLNWLSNALRT